MLLVVGQGLLGGAVVRARPSSHAAIGIPWTDERAAISALCKWLDAAPVAEGEPIALAWCAGAATPATDRPMVEREVRMLSATLEHFAAVLDRHRPPQAVVFLTSSAGGLHGATSSGAISESTVPTPHSHYGEGKLAQEAAVQGFHAHTGNPVLIGRPTNLYGGAQKMSKRQGLITHLCHAALLRRSLSITVPLDTARDYIHVDDAAARIVRWLDQYDDGCATKVIAAEHSHSVASIVDTVRRVTRLRPPVSYARLTTAQNQARHQVFQSTVRCDLDRAVPARSLTAGVYDVWQSLLSSYRRSGHSG